MGDFEDLSQIQEENTTLHKSSQGRKQSVSQQPKPRRSLLKFEEAVNNHSQNNRGGVSQIPSSINTVRGDQSMRRKQSNLNVTSPKMQNDYEYLIQQDMQKKRGYHKQGSNNTYQTIGTSHSIGANQSPQLNNHQMNQYSAMFFQHPHLSQFYQDKQRPQHFLELNVDNGVQSQVTRLSNQKSGLSQNNMNNQLNYRKTATTIPMIIQDEQTFVLSFDKMKDFQFYLPYFNSQNVVRRANTYLIKIQKKKKIRTGKKAESGTLRKKKQQSANNLNNINNTKLSSMQRLGTIRNSKLQAKSINEFSLNIVSADAAKGEKQTPNLVIKSDKSIQDDI